MSRGSLMLLMAVGTAATFLSCATAQDIVAVRWNGDVYAIHSDDGSGALIGYSGTNSFDCLTRLDDGRVVVLRRFNRGLLSIDPNVGDALYYGDVFLDDVRGLATGSDGLLYAIEDGYLDNDELYRVNPTNHQETFIGTCDHRRIEGLAFDSNGTLYGWDQDVGLVTVNSNTGTTTDVSAQFGGSFDISTIAFAPDGRLFGARYELFEIDKSTGEISLIGGGPYADLRGMEFLEPSDEGCLELEVTHLTAGQSARFTARGSAPDGTTVAIVYGLATGVTDVQNQFGYCARFGIRGIRQNRLVGQGALMNGEYSVTRPIPTSVQYQKIYFQAAQRGTCPHECLSNVKAREVE